MGQFANIRHLLRKAISVYLRPYWKLHLPMAVAIAVVVGFETFFPLTIKFLIDEALIPHDSQQLIKALVMLTLLIALSVAARMVLAIIRAYMNAELNKDFRVLLVRLMQRLPMSYFDNAQPAHFAPPFDTELVTLSRMVRDLFSKGFHAALQFIVVMITMAILNWQMALGRSLSTICSIGRRQRRSPIWQELIEHTWS